MMECCGTVCPRTGTADSRWQPTPTISSSGPVLDEGLQPWSGVRCAMFSSSPAAEHFVDVTGHLDRGVESLAAHEVYLGNLSGGFDPEEFLRAQATEAGRRAGVPLAVAFEVVPL
jgi:hypothetical protein